MDILARIHENLETPGGLSETTSGNISSNDDSGGHSRESSRESQHLSLVLFSNKHQHRAQASRDNPAAVASSKDPIATFFENLVYACDYQKDLDIYHVAALRRLDKKSRKREYIACKNIGSFAFSIPSFSRYHENLGITIIVAVLQMFGISAILVSEMFAYFVNKSHDAKCDYEREYWTLNGTTFKILASLWSLFISLYVFRSIHTQRHSALYEMLLSVQCSDYHKLAFIDIGWVYFGLMVNIYTLFCACIGSFFLIYAAEAGEEAMGIVMNAVALFFMLEVDDLLVVENDFNMLRKIIEDLTKKNNEAFIKWDDKKNYSILNGTYGAKVEVADIENKCMSVRTFQRINNTLNVFIYAVELFTVLAGFVGPIVLFICW